MRETTNSEDPYTVAVIRNSAVVGHVLCKMSAVCVRFQDVSSLMHVCAKEIMRVGVMNKHVLYYWGN